MVSHLGHGFIHRYEKWRTLRLNLGQGKSRTTKILVDSSWNKDDCFKDIKPGDDRIIGIVSSF